MNDDEAVFEVKRGHVQEGRTFSQDAMEALNHTVLDWLMWRLITKWEATNVPPTRLVLHVSVEIQ
jgi:hypothetical protein